MDLRSDGKRASGSVSVSSLRRSDLALMAASVAPFLYTLFDSSNGDVPLYHHCAERLLSGAVPYRDWVFEYPPYALLWFLLPGAMHGYVGFRALFSLQVLVLDLAAKVVLLREGERAARHAKGNLIRLGPFLLFSLLGIFQTYFYLKRLDPIAAALVLVALAAFANERMAAAGALLAVAAGTKLYPALAAPALVYLAFQRGKALRFVAGGAAALVPLAVLSAIAPWWSFASFQAARGIQVESTYGSALWLLHFFGTPATWVGRLGCCVEIGGPLSELVAHVARVVFGATVLTAVAASVAAAGPSLRLEMPDRPSRASTADDDESARSARIGRLALLPIVAFMASSLALSPQFAVWLIGPAALAMRRGRRAALVMVALAVMLTVFVFPAPGYFVPSGVGISLGRTVVLVARNIALLAALGLLAREVAANLASARARSAADGTVVRER
jgi:Glycosyltransferase family 87